MERKCVYVVDVSKGSWDDFTWWIHGIYDDPFKADEAKRLLLAKIEEDKLSDDMGIACDAKSINLVDVREFTLNEVAEKK